MKKIFMFIFIVFVLTNNILFAQQSKEISSFFQSVRKNNISNVEKKMKSGFNTDGMIGVVALYNAKTPKMYRALIENGLELDGIYGALALIDAIDKGDLESVKILIDNGADLNTRAYITDDIKKEITSLKKKEITSLNEQLSEKAKEDSKKFQSLIGSSMLLSPLKLLDDIDDYNDDYNDYIIMHRFLDPKEGGIPDTPFTYVLRPLNNWSHWVTGVVGHLSNEKEKYYLDLMDLMLESKKVDFAKTIYYNEEQKYIHVLHYAIITDPNMVQKFINAGASLTYNNGSFFDTPLTFILRMKYFEKNNNSIRSIKNDEISYLINAGADVNRKNGFGYFPLIFAAHYHDLDVAELLIKAGADVNMKSEEIFFDDMIKNADLRKKERIEEFREKVNDITEKTVLIELAKFTGNKEMIDIINAQKVKYGYSALYYSVKDNDFEMTKLLLDNGAKLDDEVKRLLPRAVPDIQRLFKY